MPLIGWELRTDIESWSTWLSTAVDRLFANVVLRLVTAG